MLQSYVCAHVFLCYIGIGLPPQSYTGAQILQSYTGVFVLQGDMAVFYWFSGWCACVCKFS